MFLGLSSFKTTGIGKLSYITYIDEYLINYMMQNSKKGLLPFGFGVVFLRINVLKHLRREISFMQNHMPL